MKKGILFHLLFLFGLSCCSKAPHNFLLPGKIPIAADRWYQLNNCSKGLNELFDGKINQEVNPGQGALLKHYEAWYPVLPGEQITIDSVMMYDGATTGQTHAMTIFAITGTWEKKPLATFIGSGSNQWVGPDPDNPGVFSLPVAASGIRYLVIDTWGQFPDEIEFYGRYKAPDPITPAKIKPRPLRDFFGINAFEWDFEDGIGAPDPKKLELIKNFTGFRHYMDWEKLEPTQGNYCFNPVRSGGWNYDTIYSWCKNNGIEVLACLKTIPGWMQASYPDGERDNENVPARFGSDLNDPESYREQAKVAFQYAARYGYNKNVDAQLLSVDARPRWTGDPVNQVKWGMGHIKYIECDNERDKWWKGRKAYQTGREYAANLSAFYDGNMGKMGPGIGVKNADRDMKVVMAGLAMANTDYVRGIIDWSLQYRGIRKDGSADLPFDIINYHDCSNDYDQAGSRQTRGVAPELGKIAVHADHFIQMAHQYARDMPVWVTETCYDINAQSNQRAPAIKDKTAMQTQADWILRTSLLYAKSGIQKVFFYELDDVDLKNSTNYASSGLVNADHTPRPAANFLLQANKLFGDFSFDHTINADPAVDRYSFHDYAMYTLTIPDQQGRAATYILDLGNAETAYIYKPNPTGTNMDIEKIKTKNGKAEILVTETPVFVTGYDCTRIKK